jgi:hypothetical protein
VGKVRHEWLERSKIEYVEIYFGKPNAHVYVDDRAPLRDVGELDAGSARRGSEGSLT